MVLGSWYIRIQGFIKENGAMIRKKGMELKNFPTDALIKVPMSMASHKE